MRLTVPLTNATPGAIVTAEFKPYMSPHIERSGIVVHVDDEDGVLVDFGPGVGHRCFNQDGNERSTSRWAARVTVIEPHSPAPHTAE